MDQSNRRKLNSPRRNNLRKSVQEVNGNNTTRSAFKVENSRRQKNKRAVYKKNDEESHDRIGDTLPNYIPLHGQRLFTAMSDPAVCGYPVSLGYPYDTIPVPVGYPLYHTAPYPHRFSYKDTMPMRSKIRNNQEKSDQLKDGFQTVDEYTSLPPGNLQDIESDHQRRFSDPGLANNSGSEEDSLSNKGSSESWFEESHIAAQIETLVLENKRLSKELKATQSDLQELKFDVASITQMQSTCEPGLISDLVREVHEATKIREETFLARLRVFSENYQKNLGSSSISADKKKECCLQCEETKCQLDKANLEKEELSGRLTKLEEQMKLILAHNSVNGTCKGEKDLQKEKLQLQQELRTAVDARSIAEANATKFERIFNCITKKLPNGLVLEEKPMSPLPSASLDSSESLSSSMGSSSIHSHSPQVTMSGPVTDL